MTKCKMCDTHMTNEDLLVDDRYCINCINLSDGEDEVYGVMYSIRVPGGDLYLIKKKDIYVVDTVTQHYESETESHLRANFYDIDDATEFYLNLMRSYL